MAQVTKTQSAQKPAQKPVQKAMPKIAGTYYMPAPRPATVNNVLFAYTAAVIAAVEQCPVKHKQAGLAYALHGATAMKHHKARIVVNADKSVTYDSYLRAGKDSTDKKRTGVPDSWIAYFAAIIKTGKAPAKKPDGLGFTLLDVEKNQVTY